MEKQKDAAAEVLADAAVTWGDNTHTTAKRAYLIGRRDQEESTAQEIVALIWCAMHNDPIGMMELNANQWCDHMIAIWRERKTSPVS
jgi:hypothetical protein